ncbi:MAG: glycosyltransferase family 2 protein [Candidatus Competibacteraceae bacterium]
MKPIPYSKEDLAHVFEAVRDDPPDTDTDVVVSILIANYNGRELLRNCLKSIYEHPCRFPFEVLVVDDHSRDGSFEAVRDEFPRVRLFRNNANMHYATSNNRMFDLARGKFLYLLNSDTIMLEGAIDRLVEWLDTHPRTGCVGSKLLNEDGSIQASVKTLPNLRSAFFGARSPIAKLFPNNPLSARELLHLSMDLTEPFQAGYVSSASWLMPRQVVDEVGYLDPRLSYHVDADYCARIQKAGWEVWYLPTAVVIHLDHKGGTLYDPYRRFKAVLEFHRGSWIFFERHEMKSWFHPLTWIVIGGLAVRFMVSLTMQQLGEIAKLLRSAKRQAPELDR